MCLQPSRGIHPFRFNRRFSIGASSQQATLDIYQEHHAFEGFVRELVLLVSDPAHENGTTSLLKR